MQNLPWQHAASSVGNELVKTGSSCHMLVGGFWVSHNWEQLSHASVWVLT
jgi:hypothetical protein